MTRKDYVLIAGALKRAQHRTDGADAAAQMEQRLQHKICCMELCAALERDNSAFNADKFLQACGVQS